MKRFILLVFTLFQLKGEHIAAEKVCLDSCTNPIPKEVLHELNSPNLRFSDHTMNHFIKLVVATTNFDMVDVLYYYFPELYKKCDKDDIQILYGGEIEMNAMGHFVCVLYRKEKQTVYVYDSLHQKELHERQNKIINNLYPGKKYISFIEMKIKQTDNTSCGPFAIAYATTLILGEDPVDYEYKMDLNGTDPSHYMRNHIRRMFECYELKHFPRITSDRTEL